MPWEDLRPVFYPAADAVSANSRGALMTMRAYCPEVKLRHTPNPLILADRTAGSRSNAVLFLARLVPQKAPDVLIDAFASFIRTAPGWTLHIAGDGSMADELLTAGVIDFSGKRPTVVDRRTGEVRSVELFVAVLGASSYTYAEATATQQLPDWVGAHTRMVEYFGGTTALWVPDQLKSAITRSCRYEAGVNRTYAELAAHDEAVVVPARPGKPKDKAVVESAVLVAQRWILARLRDQTFFSLAALNAAIWARLRDLNDRPLQQLGVSRRTRYDQLDRPALRPLPTCRYVLAEWKPCRVSIDYHIQVDRHLSSVPYQLIHDWWRCGLRRRPSKSTRRGGGSPRISAGTMASRPPRPRTCPSRIEPTPNGPLPG